MKADRFAKVSAEWGLAPEERDHFFEGIQGGTNEPLSLSPVKYDHVQKGFEQTSLEALRRKRARGAFFAYLTPRPLSPFYMRDHVRHKVAAAIFAPEEPPVAISVMDETAVKNTPKILITPDIVKISSVIEAARDDIFSLHTDFGEGGSYMAFKGVNGDSAIAFEGLQMHMRGQRGPLDPGGTVIFGSSAEEMHRRALALHANNLKEGRGRAAVLKALGLNGAEPRVLRRTGV